MVKSLRACFLPLLMVICIWGCGDTPDVQVSMSALRSDEATYSVARINADLLREIPKNPLDKPSSIMMITQGDQITVIESGPEWYRVQHVLSGQMGWLHSSFVQLENRSKWWSGDTDRARKMAQTIYKEKIFLEKSWPIIHINIEERWNKLVFTVRENVDFPKDQAIQCSDFAIGHLIRYFPDWRDHQVFLTAQWKGETYSLIMGDNKKPTFL